MDRTGHRFGWKRNGKGQRKFDTQPSTPSYLALRPRSWWEVIGDACGVGLSQWPCKSRLIRSDGGDKGGGHCIAKEETETR